MTENLQFHLCDASLSVSGYTHSRITCPCELTFQLKASQWKFPSLPGISPKTYMGTWCTLHFSDLSKPNLLACLIKKRLARSELSFPIFKSPAPASVKNSLLMAFRSKILSVTI